MNPRISRRSFIKVGMAGGAALFLPWRFEPATVRAQAAGPSLDPMSIPKYVTPLLIPPVMPRAGTITQRAASRSTTTRSRCGSSRSRSCRPACRRRRSGATARSASASKSGLLLHNAPSLTIEAKWNRPVRVKWINELVDASGNYLPHLLPVDPTLHWANPPGGTTGRDSAARRSPITTRPVHRPGADRHPRPRRRRRRRRERRLRRGLVPAGARTTSRPATRPRAPGTTSSRARPTAQFGAPGARAPRPSSTRTPSRASTIWYHDHALGMTRLNVYAGPGGLLHHPRRPGR